MKKTIFISILLLNISMFMFGQELKSKLEFAHLGKLESANTKIKLPIEVWNDLILVKAKFNGVEGTFVWDNGFYISGLDSLFIKKALVKKYDSNIEARDANNKIVELKQFLSDRFEIGKILITKTPILQVNIKSILQSQGKSIDGLIGASIINKLNWKFDFDNNFVEISDKPFIKKNSKELPFEIIESNAHIMKININGYDLQTLIDFGYNADDISINIQGAALFQGNKASEEYGINKIGVSGLNEIDTTYVIKKNYKFELAGHKFNFLPKVSIAKSNSNISLGNKFFRNSYNVIINCKDFKYILSNRKNPIKQNTDKSFGILLLLKENHFYIGKLTTNPNIKNKTLKIMEEVLEINNKKPSDFEDNFSLINYQKNLLNLNKSLNLKLKNGEVLSFTPEYDIEQ